MVLKAMKNSLKKIDKKNIFVKTNSMKKQIQKKLEFF